IDDWLREFMLVTSLFVLLAGISIAFKHQFGFGSGALERLAQYPESVWLILFGFYISRGHYRNGVVGRRFKFSETGPAAQKSTFGGALRESVRSARRKAVAGGVSGGRGRGARPRKPTATPQPPPADPGAPAGNPPLPPTGACGTRNGRVCPPIGGFGRLQARRSPRSVASDEVGPEDDLPSIAA